MARSQAASGVVGGVQVELARMPVAVRDGALARAALELALTIDQGLSVASCARELRETMRELRALAEASADRGDRVDDLARARAARRAAASDR